MDAVKDIVDGVVNGIVGGAKASIIGGVKWLTLTIIDSSYTICLTVAIVGLICYCAGYKKGAKAVTFSIIVFVVLQAIKVVIK